MRRPEDSERVDQGPGNPGKRRGTEDWEERNSQDEQTTKGEGGGRRRRRGERRRGWTGREPEEGDGGTSEGMIEISDLDDDLVTDKPKVQCDPESEDEEKKEVGDSLV